MKKSIYYPLTTLGFILLIVLCFIFLGGQNSSKAQRVGRMGFLTEDANSRDHFVYKMVFPTTSITTSSTTADATVDFGVAGGWSTDTANSYIYTTDGNYVVGINDDTPDGQLDITISGAAVVGLDIDGAAAQSAHIVDIDDATGDALFTIDAGGHIGIGTNAPLSGPKMHIYAGASGQSSAHSSGQLVIEDNISTGLNILTPNTAIGYLMFGDVNDNYGGGVEYNHATDKMTIQVDNVDRVFIDANGSVGINVASPTVPLEVNGQIKRSGSRQSVYTITGAYTLDATNDIVLANGTFTVKLPAIVADEYPVWRVMNIGSGTITIDATTDATTYINDATSDTLAQYDGVTITNDGTAYWEIP